MSDKSFQKNIANLFSNKKYAEIISVIDETYRFKKKPPGLSNLSGICKILKQNSNQYEIISALNDFEECYHNSTIVGQKVEVVCNYITTCIKYSEKFIIVLDYLEKARVLFEDFEKKNGYEEKLFLHAADLYQSLLNHNKLEKILNILIKNKTKSKIIACSYAFTKNYTDIWKSKDYYDYSVEFKKLFPIYKSKKINEINYSKNKKIRIGFVGKDLTVNHSITYFLKNTLKYIDKSKFELYGFSLESDKFLEASSFELKDNFHRWFDLSGSNNQEVINKVQDERIEILFDVMGLTHADRIEIFNTRVSPVQISWLAFNNIVGFSTIDYLIADRHLIKEEEKIFYPKVINLPKIWSCHSGFNFKREYSVAPFKQNKYVTFGSLNNFLKISDDVIKVWSIILNSVHNSKLILKSSLNYNKRLILDKFKPYGVENAIEIYDRNINLEEHLKLYKKIDIGLDTFPYNGVTTTFEALWSGIPVIVMRGFNMNSRTGESILMNGNIADFLALNHEDYLNKAIFYSNNLDRLDQVRNDIFNNVLKTSLFNSENFSNDIKNSLLNIYNRDN